MKKTFTIIIAILLTQIAFASVQINSFPGKAKGVDIKEITINSINGTSGDFIPRTASSEADYFSQRTGLVNNVFFDNIGFFNQTVEVPGGDITNEAQTNCVNSANDQYPPDNCHYAFDKNLGTTGTVASPGWIGQDFGTNVKIISMSYQRQWGSQPVSFDFQYSDDNTTWYNTNTTSVSFNDGNLHSYDVNDVGSHRYWRLDCLSAYLQAAEITMSSAASNGTVTHNTSIAIVNFTNRNGTVDLYVDRICLNNTCFSTIGNGTTNITGGGGNPFDQSLNTSDEVRFSRVGINTAPNPNAQLSVVGNIINDGSFGDHCDATTLGMYTARFLICGDANGAGNEIVLTWDTSGQYPTRIAPFASADPSGSYIGFEPTTSSGTYDGTVKMFSNGALIVGKTLFDLYNYPTLPEANSLYVEENGYFGGDVNATGRVCSAQGCIGDGSSVTYYLPSSIETIDGTVNSGTYMDAEHVDGNYYNVSESGNWSVYLNFTGVTTNITQAQYYVKYTQANTNKNHIVYFEIQDCNDLTWESHGVPFGDSSNFIGVNIAMFDSSKHVCNDGSVRTRFRHEGNPSSGDYFIVDMVNLVKGNVVTGQSGGIDPRYLRVDGLNLMNNNISFYDGYGINASSVLNPPWYLDSNPRNYQNDSQVNSTINSILSTKDYQNGTQVNNTINSVLAMIEVKDFNWTITNGGTLAGNSTSAWNSDGDTINVSETGQFRVTFRYNLSQYNVSTFNNFAFKIAYNGASTHFWNIYLQECSGVWEDGYMTSLSTTNGLFLTRSVYVDDPLSHICNGIVNISVYHETAGANPTHRMYIDKLVLLKGFSGQSSTDIYPTLFNITDNSTQYPKINMVLSSGELFSSQLDLSPFNYTSNLSDSTGTGKLVREANASFTGFINLTGGSSAATPISQITFGGQYLDNAGVPSPSHIDLYGNGVYGFGLTSNTVNYLTNINHRFYTASGALQVTINTTGTYVGNLTTNETINLVNSSGVLLSSLRKSGTINTELIFPVGDLIITDGSDPFAKFTQADKLEIRNINVTGQTVVGRNITLWNGTANVCCRVTGLTFGCISGAC